MERNKNILLWVLGLLLLAMLGPLLGDHFTILWDRRHYQWFPLLLLIVLVLLVVQWLRAKPATTAPARRWLNLGLVGCMLLTVVAYLYYTGWVAAVAAIGVIGLLTASLTGSREMKGAFGICALLLLLVRLPHQIEGRLLNLFESVSSKVASVIIDQSGTYHVMQGELLVIEGYEIELGMITNGYFSVFSVAAMAALYALWRKRPTFHALLLIGTAFAVATVVNVLRIATVGIVYAKAGWDVMDSGWMYVMLVVSFGLSFLILLSFDALYSFLLTPVVPNEHKREGRWLIKLWNALVEFRISRVLEWFRQPIEGQKPVRRQPILATVLVVCLLSLAAFEAVVLYYRWGFGSYQTYFMHDKKDLAIIDPSEVQFARPGWKLIEQSAEEREFSSIWGAYSYVWRLEYHDTMVVMALDYPFDKWHDVKVCYGNLGWKTESEALVNPGKKGDWGASQTEMSLPTGDYGFILCSHCDHKGAPVQPKPTSHQFDMVKYYLHPKQWTAPFGVSVDKNKNTFYQTQVMVTTAFPLDEPTRQEIREMYGEFRAQTRALIEQKSGE